MRKSLHFLTALTVIAGITLVSPQPAPSAEAEQKADEPVAFNPMMGALMNMFVQPRHAKLGLAANDANWVLATHELKELKRTLNQITAAVPRWKGLPVPDLFEAALEDPLTALDAAIKAGNARQFTEAYGQLTAGCNACHATTDHPFVVLKTPDASEYPDQDFKPQR